MENLKKIKKRDQYFLKNQEIIKRQVNYLNIKKTDVILEIGPGPGNLTKEIIKETPRKVRLIERDKRLVNHLKKRFSDNENIEIIHGDALKKDFGDFNKTISNLPYSISSEITFKLLKHEFDGAIWTYQKEFAERMTAQVGTKEYGRLTINSQIFADIELLEIIPRHFFEPQPRVDSAIVKIEPKKDYQKIKDIELFRDLVKGVFTQRRKKLKNAIENSLHIIKSIEESDLKYIKKDISEFLERRPDSLKPKEFVEISNKIKEVL